MERRDVMDVLLPSTYTSFIVLMLEITVLVRCSTDVSYSQPGNSLFGITTVLEVTVVSIETKSRGFFICAEQSNLLYL